MAVKVHLHLDCCKETIKTPITLHPNACQYTVTARNFVISQAVTIS